MIKKEGGRALPAYLVGSPVNILQIRFFIEPLYLAEPLLKRFFARVSHPNVSLPAFFIGQFSSGHVSSKNKNSQLLWAPALLMHDRPFGPCSKSIRSFIS
jgi:hypothetical protein